MRKKKTVHSGFVAMTLLLTVMLTGYSVCGQYKNYKPVSDLVSFRKVFAAESQKVQSISSDFTQDKVLMALTEKITSSGKFWYKRNNKVRIDYLKPFQYSMIMNGDKMLVRDQQKENRINVKSNKLFQQVNHIMVDCVQGTILDSKDFTTRVFEDGDSYLLEMTPVAKSLKEFFKNIVLVVEKKDYSVKTIDMNEPGGDVTTIMFSNKVINAEVAEKIFAF